MALTKIKATSISSLPVYVLDDVSPYIDGTTGVFNLTLDNYSNVFAATGLTIVDSKDLDVQINNIPVTPHVKRLSFPWFVVYEPLKGFRVAGDKIVFYPPPALGSYISIVFRNRSLSEQTRRYPFTAGTIALGD